LLHEAAALARGDEHEHGVGLGILHALQERRKIGNWPGHLDLLDDLAAAGGKIRLKKFKASLPGAKSEVRVATFLMPFLDRPVGDDGAGLRQRKTGTHNIGRTLGDDRGAAAITISGILPWVAKGAAANAAGVTPKPA